MKVKEVLEYEQRSHSWAKVSVLDYKRMPGGILVVLVKIDASDSPNQDLGPWIEYRLNVSVGNRQIAGLIVQTKTL